MPESVRAEVDRVIKQRTVLTRSLDRLVPESIKAVKTRCHGDYHLGQVVVARDDFFIIDFEGEPGRALKDRRAKQSPLYDVAGMIWSIHRAAWETLFRCATEQPGLVDSLRPLMEAWERDTITAFKVGYESAIGDSPSYPAEEDAQKGLLALFLFEKVFYELSGEALERARATTVGHISL